MDAMMTLPEIQAAISEAYGNELLQAVARRSGSNGTTGTMSGLHLSVRRVNIPDGNGWYKGGAYAPSAVELGNVIYTAHVWGGYWSSGKDGVTAPTQRQLAEVYPLYVAYKRALEALDAAHGWEEYDRIYWMDNSVDSKQRSAFNPALTRRVMVTAPHGDACY